jgi:MYXO-CTERM domain-containing protein
MWINTNPLGRIWEQMHLSYEKGVRTIFLVNVGDIKPMEYPIEFFLDYAWNPDVWPAERLPEYARLWAERQFGATHAATIADLLTKYTKYNGRRKPEILAPTTYSHVNYREAERVAADYNAIAATAQQVNDALPMNARDAFFQLVLFPVKACANLNDLYITVGKNALYRRQNRAATNDLATRAQQLYAMHATLTNQYHSLAGGKWTHMMKQTLIGTHPTDAWRNPDVNTMPAVMTLTVPSAAALGVSIEGTENVWPGAAGTASLPEMTPFDPPGSNQYIDVFNKGTTAFAFTATAQGAPWLTLTPASGQITKETRVLVTVNWAQAPTGAAVMDVPITITGPNNTSTVVNARIRNPPAPRPETLTGFAQTDGYVSIEAEHATRVVATAPVAWTRIPDFGRTLSGMTLTPTTAAAQTPGSGPRLEYDIHFFTTGSFTVQAYVAPTLPYHRSGLRYAISFDNVSPTMVNINSDTSTAAWERNVRDNVNVTSTTHTISAAGAHTLKFWAVDTGVVLQKLVVSSSGGARTTYLGPPASAARTAGTVVTGTGGAGGRGGSGAAGTTGGGGISGAAGTTGGGGISGAAGTTGGAGTTGAGGTTGAAGTSGGTGTAGAGGDGTPGVAGTSGIAGTSGSGVAGASGTGNGGSTGTGASGASSAGVGGSGGDGAAGCACSVPGGGASPLTSGAIALALGLMFVRRRRRSR